MKKIIIGVLLFAALFIGYMFGNEAARKMITEDYIDMRQVVNYEATDNGLYLHLSDGTNYYWEK